MHGSVAADADVAEGTEEVLPTLQMLTKLGTAFQFEELLSNDTDSSGSVVFYEKSALVWLEFVAQADGPDVELLGHLFRSVLVKL